MNVDEVIAKQEIGELLVRYATAIDTRDWDLFRTVFTEDCVTEYGGQTSTEGIDRLTRFMVKAHQDFGHTLHRLSNTAVTLHGETAQARTYVDAVLYAPDASSGFNAVGWYDDDIVRVDGAWRIAVRRFTMASARAID